MGKFLRAIAIATAVVIAFCVSPVSAYPPGVPMTVSLTPDMILAKTGKTKLLINKAKPSSNVTITVNKKSSSTVASATGAITKNLTGYTAGIYTISVRTPVYPEVDDEVKSVVLYVPNVTAPKSGKITAKTTVKVAFVKPGTILTLAPKAGKKAKKTITVKLGAKATSATITIPAKTFIKGATNTFVLTVGKAFKTTYKFTGK
ncbi:MAG: hypothetical protein KGQ38_02115 [Actinomycetales bacterium]|nr:hypothetical protein [Actinomycetales bacterium]